MAACTDGDNSEVSTMATAIEAGVLMDFEQAARVVNLLQIAPVNIGTLYEERSMDLNIGFLVQRNLMFEGQERQFDGFHVTNGQFVQAGDILASATFDGSELFLAQHRNAQNDLYRFETDFLAEQNRRQVEISEMQIAFDRAPANERERLLLNLTLQELRYEQFLSDTRRQMDDMRQSIQETTTLLATEYMTAPFDGVVMNLAAIGIGSPVEGRNMVVLAEAESVVLTVRTPHMHIIRYGDVFSATLANTTFDVIVVSDPFATGHRQGNADFLLKPLEPNTLTQIIQTLDNDWRALMEHRNREVNLIWNMFGESIILHRGAIQQSSGRTIYESMPYVTIYDDGVFRQRFITLGPYGTSQVATVVSGLEAGQKVVGHR